MLTRHACRVSGLRSCCEPCQDKRQLQHGAPAEGGPAAAEHLHRQAARHPNCPYNCPVQTFWLHHRLEWPRSATYGHGMTADESPLPGALCAGADGQQFVKWCGLLVNVHTLELQADYTRYAGASLAASLTIPRSKVGRSAARSAHAGEHPPQRHVSCPDATTPPKLHCRSMRRAAWADCHGCGCTVSAWVHKPLQGCSTVIWTIGG